MHPFDEWILKVNDSISSAENMQHFLQVVDDMNTTVYPLLKKITSSSLYAKAILLKISNILVSKYQYHNRQDFIVAKPFGLIVDPANGCPDRRT